MFEAMGDLGLILVDDPKYGVTLRYKSDKETVWNSLALAEAYNKEGKDQGRPPAPLIKLISLIKIVFPLIVECKR